MTSQAQTDPNQVETVELIRVLLVEDDDTDAMMTSRAFRKISSRFELTRARTGEEAVRFLRNRTPHLVLLDLNLGPGMSGHEVLELAKEDDQLRSVPFVALTSSTMEDEVLRSWNLQVAGFLHKPVRPSAFQAVAGTLAEWWTAQELPGR